MRPDLEAIRARNLVDWTGNGKEELSGDVAALLAYVEELKAEVASLEDMLDNAHAREDANWFEVNRLKDRIAELERVRP